jgi:hypothetical protein
MIITTLISLKLYKKIKADIKQQEINSIDIEINRHFKTIKNTNEKQTILGLEKKIKALKKEKEELNRN